MNLNTKGVHYYFHFQAYSVFHFLHTMKKDCKYYFLVSGFLHVNFCRFRSRKKFNWWFGWNFSLSIEDFIQYFPIFGILGLWYIQCKWQHQKKSIKGPLNVKIRQFGLPWEKPTVSFGCHLVYIFPKVIILLSSIFGPSASHTVNKVYVFDQLIFSNWKRVPWDDKWRV